MAATTADPMSAEHPNAMVIQGITGLKELAKDITRTIDEIDGGSPSVRTVGVHLGWSDPLEITQECVNTFAEATGDFQWIHVDPEKAKAESPFGGPIAHGYLTLSLGPSLAPQIFTVTGITMGVNYGTGKVRFPSPVPVGANLRLGAQLTAVEDIPGGAQVYMTFTFQCDGADKPSCVAEIIFRYYE
jgi:acyl dehydratase